LQTGIEIKQEFQISNPQRNLWTNDDVALAEKELFAILDKDERFQDVF